jgi:acyl-CoA thioesterase FadM
MSKIKYEPKRALLETFELTRSDFAIEGNNKKDRNYFKATYFEIEELVHNYEKRLIARYWDQFMLVMKDSKTSYRSAKGIGRVVANIWVSYIDSYHIVLSCEIASSSQVIARYDKTLLMVSRLNGDQIKIPVNLIEEFVSDLSSNRKKVKANKEVLQN